jgi:hypothetical protein
MINNRTNIVKMIDSTEYYSQNSYDSIQNKNQFICSYLKTWVVEVAVGDGFLDWAGVAQ